MRSDRSRCIRARSGSSGIGRPSTVCTMFPFPQADPRLTRAIPAPDNPGGAHGRTISVMHAADDDALLGAMAAGDQEAAARFVRRHQRQVYGLAFSVTGDGATAEDVAQEAFTRAWRHAASFDPRRASATTWLLTITRNLAI